MLHALLVLSISDSSDSTVSEIVMSNEGFFKVVCFRFPTNVFKKSNIFVFETKFIFEPKRSLSDLKFIGLYSNVLLLQKKLEQIKKFWFYSKIFGINRNVPF